LASGWWSHRNRAQDAKDTMPLMLTLMGSGNTLRLREAKGDSQTADSAQNQVQIQIQAKSSCDSV